MVRSTGIWALPPREAPGTCLTHRWRQRHPLPLDRPLPTTILSTWSLALILWEDTHAHTLANTHTRTPTAHFLPFGRQRVILALLPVPSHFKGSGPKSYLDRVWWEILEGLSSGVVADKELLSLGGDHEGAF